MKKEIEPMKWGKLLNSKRRIDRPSDSDDEVRSEFEKDADRIFFSYPFRRMQNKTQVIPVPVYDFIHTRLTHSLEVATIGNSLGRMVGQKVIKKYKLKGITEYDFGAIVKAACLAHDIGNPPFGHSGEDSIADFFKGEDVIQKFGNHFIETNQDKELNEKRWEDFRVFEGNAMGFRIITNPHYHGFNLTYATLATFMKYPRESMIDKSIDDHILKGKLVYEKKGRITSKRASQKKFGFFQSERNRFKEVAKEVGLIPLGNKENLSWCRHPLTFLVEAADDICYTLMDLEDACKIGKVDEDFVSKQLTSITGKRFIRTKVYKNLTEREKLGFIRGKAIFKLVDETARLFWNNRRKIMEGKFDKELLDVENKDFQYKKPWKEITELLNNTVYKNYRPVQELELVGSEVLRGLLELFVPVVVPVYAPKSDKKKAPNLKFPKLKTHYEDQLLNIFPKQFQLNLEEEENMNYTEKMYKKILGVVDFVSGMTDTYALQLYRKLKGIDIPHLQNLDA